MPSIDVPLARLRFGQTSRRDAWWFPPLVTFVILASFVGYASWAGIQNAHYTYGPYLSPIYSPLLFTADPSLLHHAWFGMQPAWFPWFITPAALILPAPAGFRLTCYYYRGAYYKAFWADPINCAVGEPRNEYRGEHQLPLIVMNLHRYFLYLAICYLFILAYDAYEAMWWLDPATNTKHFGIGLGTLIMCANVTLLSLYTLGCHSLRHLIGGVFDRISGRSSIRKNCYDCVTALNKRHMLFAWCSLFVVGGTDIYIRLCSMGIITDPRII